MIVTQPVYGVNSASKTESRGEEECNREQRRRGMKQRAEEKRNETESRGEEE